MLVIGHGRPMRKWRPPKNAAGGKAPRLRTFVSRIFCPLPRRFFWLLLSCLRACTSFRVSLSLHFAGISQEISSCSGDLLKEAPTGEQHKSAVPSRAHYPRISSAREEPPINVIDLSSPITKYGVSELRESRCKNRFAACFPRFSLRRFEAFARAHRLIYVLNIGELGKILTVN